MQYLFIFIKQLSNLTVFDVFLTVSGRNKDKSDTQAQNDFINLTSEQYNLSLTCPQALLLKPQPISLSFAKETGAAPLNPSSKPLFYKPTRPLRCLSWPSVIRYQSLAATWGWPSHNTSSFVCRVGDVRNVGVKVGFLSTSVCVTGVIRAIRFHCSLVVCSAWLLMSKTCWNIWTPVFGSKGSLQ